MLIIKKPFHSISVICTILISFQLSHAQKIKSKESLTTNGHTFIHQKRVALEKSAACETSPFRTMDGTCNNMTSSTKFEWGASDVLLMREMAGNYDTEDPFNAMNGQDRPSPRAISNALNAQEEYIGSERNLSSMVFTWGQFVDHDIDLTPEGHTEYAPISLPDDEPLFTQDIPFFRSAYADGTGNSSPREQRNLITSWHDASNVYGSDDTRASWLRTFQSGKLKTSSGNLLPFNTIDGEYDSEFDENAPAMAGDSDRQSNKVKTFVAGDIRAAEQPGLTSLHTLFVREHNRLCDVLMDQGMTNDEEIYQTARKWVGALVQSITYNEFLPAIGITMGNYHGYDSDDQPDIFNLFATAAYRLGHTMVTEELLLIDNACNDDGSVSLLEGFFNPEVLREHNIGRILNGLSNQQQEAVDLQVINNLRNFLFGDPSSGVAFGIDLASLNIQRGRDHGIPDYNSIRTYFLGQPATKFSDITKDADRQNGLRSMYGTLENIDAWIGMLAEDHKPGSSLGPTLEAILKKQFRLLRDCDFFYFEKDNYLSPEEKAIIKNAQLSDVILANSNISRLARNVFFTNSCENANYRGNDINPLLPNKPSDNGNGDDGNNHDGDGNNHDGDRNNNDGDGNNNDGDRNNNRGDRNNNRGNGGNGNNNGGNGQGGGNNNITGDPLTNASLIISPSTDKLTIGPNPTSDIAVVDVTFNESVENAGYQIVDLSGQVVLESKNTINGSSFSETLSLTSLLSGVYLFNIVGINGEILFSEKIILSK